MQSLKAVSAYLPFGFAEQHMPKCIMYRKIRIARVDKSISQITICHMVGPYTISNIVSLDVIYIIYIFHKCEWQIELNS